MTHYCSKAPSEVLDFEIIYTTQLGNDTISTSSWQVTEGDAELTIDSPPATNTNMAATVWLSGGTLGLNYEVTNTITTAGGRIIQDSLICSIEPE
jgi:hypothetical protein